MTNQIFKEISALSVRFFLASCLCFLFLATAEAGSPPMLPDKIVQQLIADGAAEWATTIVNPGEKLPVPRAFSCLGCGDLAFANEGILLENSQACDDCGTPRTKKI